MNPIQSNGYSIFFYQSAYQQFNETIASSDISSLFILVDKNTHQYCYQKFIDHISIDKTVQLIKINAGENHKNINTCVSVWEKLTELGADRKSLLINLGGGMVTDLGGFVASTYKRGIKFINIPTTLLSMVDASVGSKTGVDLGNLKNLVGLFSNPEMVLIDTDYLETLPERQLRSGIAEIIKYGLTTDANLLEEIQQDVWKNFTKVDALVYQSINIKNNIVLQDPREENLRKTLNLGHTVGHAVESYFLEHAELENLTHGEAVAIGIIAETYISHKLHNFPMVKLESLKKYIHQTFGKISINKTHYQAILELMKHDKKNINGSIRYILLNDITDYIIDATAPLDLVIEGLDYYQINSTQ